MLDKDGLGISIQKVILKNDTFSIISDDCWGAEVYRNFNLSYRTPFVGLFVMTPCFIRMLKRLEFYIHSELSFVAQSKYPDRNVDRVAKNEFYPIGLLNNEIEIHFLHYKSREQAFQTWNKRKERINWNNLFIKLDSGKGNCTYELLKDFDFLPFPNKLCFSREEFPEIKCSISFKNWTVDGAKMYRLSLKKVNIMNWLNGKNYKPTLLYSFFYRFFIQKNRRLL